MEEPPKKKRGRKSNKEKLAMAQNGLLDNSLNVVVEPKKKRGRKPRGGKIIEVLPNNNEITIIKTNVILHLKCKLSDLESENFISNFSYEPDVNEIIPYNHDEIVALNYNENSSNVNSKANSNANSIINNDTNTNTTPCITTGLNPQNNYNDKSYQQGRGQIVYESSNEEEINVINQKLNELTSKLHINNMYDKKSACFWCTHSFDNVPIYIPKHEISGVFTCYGCFCSPECATAYLFEETLDTAARFERYSLLNRIYCKIYNYSKNILPAPSPLYTLEKFFGTLTIQEYRKQLKSDRLLLIIDKPLTRVLPEIFEDSNANLLFNNMSHRKQTPMNYRVKQTKRDIMTANFNLK